VENIKEIEPIVKDEHDKPEPDEVIDVEIIEPSEPEEKLSFDDIPFEIKRPKKDAPDPTQMSLF
jgi:topoisomerase-4 subunit A